MSKYEIGTQWRTRGGWRAMVFKNTEAGSICIHDVSPYGAIESHADAGNVCDAANLYDLIEPWVEPVEREGWINFYRKDVDIVCSRIYGGKDWADGADTGEKRIACVKIKFTEGEGL